MLLARSMDSSAKILALVLVVVAVVHAPQLRCSYAYDDVEAILEHPDLRSWDGAGALLLTNYWGSRNIGLYRPLVQLSYLVDGAGFGFDPRASHSIQMLLHLAVVGLLFIFLRRLGVGAGGAAASALLFGVNPAMLGASVWISGRTDVLSALFVLLGLISALSARARGEGLWGMRTIGLGICFLLGLMSKEMAVTLPLLVLLLPGRGHWRRLPMLGIAFGLYLVLRVSAVDGVLPSFAGDGAGVVFAEQGIGTRFAMGCRACFRLLALVVLPVGVAADHRAHAWALRDAPGGLTAVLALALYAAMLWGAWRLLSRGRRIDGFLLGGLAVSLLPILQIIPIGAVMAERFNYTPSLLLTPLLVRAVASVSRRSMPQLAALAFLGALVMGAFVTTRRIPVYTDRGSYCEDVIRAYPEDHKAWNNLGVYHYLPDPYVDRHDRDFEAADRAFARAVELHPGYARGRLNRARALLERQRLLDEDVDLRPIEEWLALGLRREHPDALNLAARADLRIGRSRRPGPTRTARLESAYERFVLAAKRFATRDREAGAWKEAGIAAKEHGKVSKMKEAYRRALELRPDIQGAAAMRRAIDE